MPAIKSWPRRASGIVILGFHSKQLRERGTEIAMFDYALATTNLLGHDVRIFVPADSPRVVGAVKASFERHFEVVFYDDASAISCDALYVIKKGTYSRVTTHIPELNHVFSNASNPHGHRFAAVSDWLARTSKRHLRPFGKRVTLPRLKRPPVVPHIVHLPETSEHLRSDLGIPEEAVVFGRHGGDATFDIDFVHAAVRSVLEERNDVWFLFLNTDQFIDHTRVVHLPPSADRRQVRLFVNTCDYMLHATQVGETFGLSVAEFVLAGSPVLTFLGSPQLAHLDLLRDDGLLLGYSGYDDVHGYLRTLPRRMAAVPSRLPETYGTNPVMARFDEVFLRY